MDETGKNLIALLGNGGEANTRINVPYFWRGGTPNAEHDWNEPMNWYNRRVPGWYDEVVVAGSHTAGNAYPVIIDFVNDVAKLLIEDGGKLIVGKEGKFSIDGLNKKELGLINKGSLIIEGELTIQRTNNACIKNEGHIINSGSLAFDKTGHKAILQNGINRFDNYGEILFL